MSGDLCPDKCWFAVLCRFWLRCSRTLRCGSTSTCLLRLRVWIRPEAWCLSLVSVVCCQVEFSVCGVSERDHEASKMSRPWPTRDFCAMGTGEGEQFTMSLDILCSTYSSSTRFHQHFKKGYYLLPVSRIFLPHSIQMFLASQLVTTGHSSMLDFFLGMFANIFILWQFWHYFGI